MTVIARAMKAHAAEKAEALPSALTIYAATVAILAMLAWVVSFILAG